MRTKNQAYLRFSAVVYRKIMSEIKIGFEDISYWVSLILWLSANSVILTYWMNIITFSCLISIYLRCTYARSTLICMHLVKYTKEWMDNMDVQILNWCLRRESPVIPLYINISYWIYRSFLSFLIDIILETFSVFSLLKLQICVSTKT